VLTLAFIILAVISFVLTFWRWAASRRFPIHQRLENVLSYAPVTILKPVKGLESNSEKCFESWFAQQYDAPVQILFGVASANDPVCPLLRRLIETHPNTDAQLVVCSKQLALNRKISTLMQLEPLIRHSVVVISDADVLAPPDILKNNTPLLEKPNIGLVNCFYRLANPTTAAMRWEAIGVNVDFWSQVLQARDIGKVDFALGAVMTLSLENLKKIGGFASLADYLADDYQLGHRIAMTGKEIAFSTVPVDCWESAHTWTQAWTHQLRWARTIRICKPIPYFFSIIGNATIWPLLLFFAPLFSGAVVYPRQIPLITFFISSFCLMFRVISAIDQQARISQAKNHFTFVWMVLLKDILDFLVWALSFVGNKIEWRGEQFRVIEYGKLEPLVSEASGR